VKRGGHSVYSARIDICIELHIDLCMVLYTYVVVCILEKRAFKPIRIECTACKRRRMLDIGLTPYISIEVSIEISLDIFICIDGSIYFGISFEKRALQLIRI